MATSFKVSTTDSDFRLVDLHYITGIPRMSFPYILWFGVSQPFLHSPVDHRHLCRNGARRSGSRARKQAPGKSAGDYPFAVARCAGPRSPRRRCRRTPPPSIAAASAHRLATVIPVSANVPPPFGSGGGGGDGSMSVVVVHSGPM